MLMRKNGQCANASAGMSEQKQRKLPSCKRLFMYKVVESTVFEANF